MVYKKEHRCEKCGKMTIARTSLKRFCNDCKIINRREWKREWLKNPINKEKHKLGLQIAREKYPKIKQENQKRYIKKHPEIIKAHTLAQNIPLNKECGICRSNKNLEKHHWDYKKPLLVATLCKDCHTIQHIKHFIGGN